MTKGLLAGILELVLEMAPFVLEEVPGVLRLEAAGKVLEDGADPVGATVTLTWGIKCFSEVAAMNKDAKGADVMSTEALAVVSAKAEGCGVFLLEPALGSTVLPAAKLTGEEPEIRAGPVGTEGTFSCLQLVDPCGWLRGATVAVALVGFSFSLFNFPKAGGGALV